MRAEERIQALDGVRSTLALEFRKLQNSQGVLRAPVASAFAIANSVSAERADEKNPDDSGNLILISCPRPDEEAAANIGGSDRRCSR